LGKDIMASNNKKAFDLKRDSVYVADPINDLCILGGTVIPSKDEHGVLDTEPTADMPLKDLRRLKKPLSVQFRNNIFARGVNTPITIVKIDDMAVVVTGKRRVRALRAANRKRIEEGVEEKLLPKVRCVIQRDASPLALAATMISENSQREDDEFADKIEKLIDFKDKGGTDDAAAVLFDVTEHTIRGWLQFYDNATPETKQAAKEGRIGPAAAAIVASIKDPEEQRVKLNTMLSAPEPSARGVKAARAAKGAKSSKALDGKRAQAAMLAEVQAAPSTSRSEKTLGFWEGVAETLKLVLGEKGVDERLTDLKKKLKL